MRIKPLASLMKKLLVDIYKTNKPYSGLGQFSQNFHDELLQAKPQGYDISFLHPKPFERADDDDLGYLPVSFRKRYMPFLNTGFDIWHSLHQFPSHLPNSKTCHILSIHDLNFLSEKSDGKAAKYLKRLQRNVDRANVITVISDYTKKLVQENLNLKGKPVSTIHNGVRLNSFPEAVKPSFVQSENFFFSIGIFNAKKNFHVLLPLMEHFDGQLILSGDHNTEYGNKIKGDIEKLGLKNKVILSGTISDQDKYWLYKNCKAFLFPSLAEGFGLPVIEAMLLGKPVFLSEYTSLPEIGGKAAYYWQSFEKQEMIKQLEDGLSDYQSNTDVVQSNIINHAKSFSWESCIESYINLYNSIS